MTQAEQTGPADQAGNDMHGRRVLITGGNSGIGVVAATELARQGAHIVLACRNSEKTLHALQQINAVAAVPAVNLAVDLASFDSIRGMAGEFLERYDRLDVLINNAGTFPPRELLSQDGLEMQMAVNHFAHFLLTHLLLDCLKASAPARVITVASKLHKNASIDFDTLRGWRKYNAQRAYGQSKLANVLFAVELAERLQGTGVTSNVLHPGAVRTDIVRDLPWLLRTAIGLMFIAPERGAQTTIMLASDPALAQTSGAYFDQCEPAERSSLADDAALRARLWEVSTEVVGAGGAETAH